ncbi:MAG: hypothetical protein ABR577_08460 [Pyrinomonadaceae bacterium]
MSEEEMQRKIEFIVETLASVSTMIDKLTETQAKDAVRVSQLEESFVLLTELARSADERADRIDKLVEVQAKDTVRVAQLEKSFVLLTELARSADERADRTEYRVAGLEEAYVNLAKIVERIEGQDRNGQSL